MPRIDHRRPDGAGGRCSDVWRRAVVAVALLSVAGGCNGETLCNLADVPSGLGVSVDPGLAGRVDSVAVKVCRDGACVERQERLPDTGQKVAFLTIEELSRDEVQATITLLDSAGKSVVERTFEVRPEASEPNGKGCGKIHRLFFRADAAGNVVLTKSD